MSAPPMAMTAMMPSTKASPVTATAIQYWSGATVNQTAPTTMASSTSAFTTCCSGNSTGREVTTSDSLPQAMMLPVKVTPPIRMAR